MAKKGKRRSSEEGNAGAGRKGQVKRRKRNNGLVSPPDDQQTSPRPVFTEVWHNNKPLELCSITEIPSDKVCGQCKREFPRRPLISVPFDIAIRHKEKWMYPNRDFLLVVASRQSLYLETFAIL